MPEPWADVRDLLDTGQRSGIFSAAVLATQDLRTSRVLFEHVCGTTESGPTGLVVHRAARFDLASLTKLITATAALRLAAAGVLDLDAPVGGLLRGRVPRGAGAAITPRHLLAHTSGLPAWTPLWESGDVLEVALRIAPVAPPGDSHTYSDIGFLWLAATMVSAAGAPLDHLLKREVLDPLEMAATRFHPLPIAALDADVVATEVCPERGLLRGQVSDRNTWHLGGIGPHAGLFGPLGDLLAFAQAWFDAPATGYLPAAIRDEAWGPPSIPGGQSWGGTPWRRAATRRSAGCCRRAAMATSRSPAHPCGSTPTEQWWSCFCAIASIRPATNPVFGRCGPLFTTRWHGLWTQCNDAPPQGNRSRGPGIEESA